MKKLVLPLLAITILSCGPGAETEPEKKVTLKDHNTTKEEGLLERARNYFQPIPEVMVSERYDLTPEKIALGKKLYFDKQLSKDGNISCNSCHNLETYGVDNKPTSPGDEGFFGERNSPTVLNAAIHISQFWDGRAADVEEQAGMPITNPVEMNIPSKQFLVDRLKKDANYRSMFKKAYPNSSGITYENLASAIGAFERTLATPSRFDDYLGGNEGALSDAEKEGLSTFIGTGCITCHNGAGIGGGLYQKFGLFGDYWEHTGSKSIDEGRFTVTQNESDKYFFKVPSLRNIEKTYPYFHDGSVQDLTQAVTIMAQIQNNKTLSSEEAESIVAFLKTLTGELPTDGKLAMK